MSGTTSYRIVIPTAVGEYKKLIEGIDKQNDALGKDSPIAKQTGEIKQGVKDMEAAAKLEADAVAADKMAEKLRQQRDALQKGVLAKERGWRRKLEGEYIESIQTMGDFTYVIDRSPKAKTPPKTT